MDNWNLQTANEKDIKMPGRKTNQLRRQDREKQRETTQKKIKQKETKEESDIKQRDKKENDIKETHQQKKTKIGSYVEKNGPMKK